MKRNESVTDDAVVPFNGAVYRTKFINYTNDGKVVSISSFKNPELNSLEISADLISVFIQFKKDFHNYNIEYFRKIKLGLITDKDDETVLVKYSYLYYLVPRNVNDYEVLFEHDSTSKKWVVHISNLLNKDVLLDFDFHVVDKNNKSFLIASYFVNTDSLEDGTVSFNFNSQLEEDFDNIRILVYKNYRRYSLKEKECQI